MISSLGLERRSSDTAPRFMGLMELAKKYEIEAVRAFVTQHIKNDWPTTLEEWQGQQAEIARLEEKHCRACHPSRAEAEAPYLSSLFPEPASVIKLCMKYHIHEPLSAAFYQLSLIKPADDFDRWKNENGKPWKYSQLQRGDINYPGPLDHWRRTARWSLLDGDVFMRLLLGREALDDIRRVFVVPRASKTCTRGGQYRSCSKELEEIYGTKFTTTHGEPLGFFEHCARVALELKSRACDSCYERNRGLLDTVMQRIWSQLPHVFSVTEVCTPVFPSRAVSALLTMFQRQLL